MASCVSGASIEPVARGRLRGHRLLPLGSRLPVERARHPAERAGQRRRGRDHDLGDRPQDGAASSRRSGRAATATLSGMLAAQGFDLLPLDQATAEQAAYLPPLHAYLFDRVFSTALLLLW